MTAPLRIAVIGAGSIGRRHIEVAQAHPSTELSAIVEPHGPTREALLAAGLPAAAAIEDASADAAIIATPTQDHFSSACAALDKGWPVLVEKPIAATLGDSRALSACAQQQGLPLVTGHHRRCHPFALSARAAVAQIGAPVGVQGFWSLRKHDSYYDAAWRRAPGAGPLMTNLSHEIDLLRFMMGDIVEVSALTSSARRGLQIEDTAALAFRFASGALGSFLMSDAGASPWAFEAASGENPAIAASGEDYLRFTGTEGALAFPSLTRWKASGPGEIEWSKPLNRAAPTPVKKVDPLFEQIGRFAALCAGAEDDVLCTAEAGTAALEMTLAAALSAQTQRPVRRGDVPDDYNGAQP